MNEYKLVSAETILAKVYRDFKPENSGWAYDAMEWIGEAIQEIGTSLPLERRFKKLEVNDHKVALPCHLNVLLGINFRGRRLPLLEDINSLDHSKDFQSSSRVNTVVYAQGEEENINTVSRREDIAAYYTLSNNYINTSFQTGTIKVYFEGLELDCNGFPMIHNEAHYTQALAWFILMKLLGRGMKHQVFQYADAEERWKHFRDMAYNNALMPTPDKMDALARVWVNLTPVVDNVTRTSWS